MKYFHVLCGRVHMDLVPAKNESEAIRIVEHMFGSASRYSCSEPYVAIKA